MKDYEAIVKAAQAGAEKYFDAQMEVLKAFCAIDCATGNEEGNRKVVDILEPILEGLGAQVEEVQVPGLGIHLVAKLAPAGGNDEPEKSPEKKGKIILNAHLDTVFGEGFTAKHPFHVDGDWAYGLGIADCKSGVMIAIYAVKIMQEAGLLPDREIEFIFNCDEETGTASGSQLYAREAPGADYAFVFEGAEEEDGKTGFVTARRGVILGQMDVTGKEAHAGLAYLDGHSAILELAHKIIEYYSFNDYEKGIYYNVAPISGGRPNGVVAGDAHAEFCVAGIPLNSDFAQVEAKLRSLEDSVTVPGTSVKVQYHTLFPAMEKGSQNSRAFELLKKPAQLLGMEITELYVPGATDGAYFSSLGIPTVDALSAEFRDIHTVEERVNMPSIRERTAFFATVLGCME